jgi:hypothetical protein
VKSKRASSKKCVLVLARKAASAQRLDLGFGGEGTCTLRKVGVGACCILLLEPEENVQITPMKPNCQAEETEKEIRKRRARRSRLGRELSLTLRAFLASPSSCSKSNDSKHGVSRFDLVTKGLYTK